MILKWIEQPQYNQRHKQKKKCIAHHQFTTDP